MRAVNTSGACCPALGSICFTGGCHVRILPCIEGMCSLCRHAMLAIPSRGYVSRSVYCKENTPVESIKFAQGLSIDPPSAWLESAVTASHKRTATQVLMCGRALPLGSSYATAQSKVLTWYIVSELQPGLVVHNYRRLERHKDIQH
jgi:hypothetical protein